MIPKKTLVSWSSGKDSAWMLHRLRQNPEIEMVGLFTTLNEEFDRVSMHGTPAAMLNRQAEAIGLPLQTLYLPNPCPMDRYNSEMKAFVDSCVAEEIETIAFGDLFLAEIREYRETQLKGTGLEPIFPLWQEPTHELCEEMLSGGLVAYVSCVDLKKLPASFAGRRWDRELLAEYPEGCDPCGENGEAHTVVVEGPMFNFPIPAGVGDRVERDGFAYADIFPLEKERGKE